MNKAEIWVIDTVTTRDTKKIFEVYVPTIEDYKQLVKHIRLVGKNCCGCRYEVRLFVF